MNHLTSVEIYIWNYLEENKTKSYPNDSCSDC